MLNRNTYFIREHVGLLKLSDTYDILDPETKLKIGEAREEIPAWTRVFRLFIKKSLMPTTVEVYEGSNENSLKLLFSIRRGVILFRSRVDVKDATGIPLGYFKSTFFSVGGAFRVFGSDDKEIAFVKGNWRGLNFRFLNGDTELGIISKKWAGIGKELFTSADHYVINIHGSPDPMVNLLLLAAGLAVDTVFKERS